MPIIAELLCIMIALGYRKFRISISLRQPDILMTSEIFTNIATKSMNIVRFFKYSEFLPYFFIGTIATIIDWGLFWISVNSLNLHYEIALILAYVTAGLFHFVANKIITFKCQSKQIGSQYSVYVLVTTSTLLLSMAIIAILVNLLLLDKMLARILTTLLMLIPNFLLHKHITFSKKIFIQPETKS